MIAELIVASEVEQDISDVYGWYEDRRVGLGNEFVDCVDACPQRNRRQPEMHAVVYQSYRRALIRRFPYAVFYESTATQVTVYCICHTARDPEKWRHRLK